MGVENQTWGAAKIIIFYNIPRQADKCRHRSPLNKARVRYAIPETRPFGQTAHKDTALTFKEGGEACPVRVS